jgi:hypothetical protein
MSQAGEATFNSDIRLNDGKVARFGTDQDFRIGFDGTNAVLQNVTSDSDITFLGNDGGSTITALTLDMSDAGAATFVGTLSSGGITTTGNTSAGAASAGDGRLFPNDSYGAFVYGNGTIYDVALGQRSTGVALGVLAGTTNVVIPSGNLVIATDGKGINFAGPTAQAGSESQILDSYETGTFTMTLGQVSASAFGVGRYVKIGRMVHFQWYSGGAINVDEGAGNATIAGLPFLTDDDANSYSSFLASHNTYCPTANTGYLNTNNTTGVFTPLDSTTNAVVNPTTGLYLMVAGTYRSKV